MTNTSKQYGGVCGGVGDNSPLYDCPECGDQTVLPEEVEEDGVVDVECPSCGAEGLTYVDDLCRVGRTISPHEDACYNEWGERWPPEESPSLQQGAYRLCERHFEEFENPGGET